MKNIYKISLRTTREISRKSYGWLLFGCLVFGLSTAVKANLKTVRDLDASVTNHTLFNLETGHTVPISDSATTKWDIGFKGTTIIVNSGANGLGTVTAQVASTNFDDLLMAPTSGYAQDSVSGNAIPTGSGNGWYNYAGPPTHIIAPIGGKTIVVKTNSGKYAKLEVISYYQGNPDLNQYTAFPPSESSKFYTFRYYIQNDGSDNLNHSTKKRFNDLNASKPEFTLFNLSLGDTIPLSDSATTKWDIGFKGTTLILNSGVSGIGLTEGQVASSSFNDLITAPTSGYAQDSVSGNAIPTGSGNGWYTYAGPPTHKIEPIPGKTIVIKLSNGKYAKLEVLSYYKGYPDLSQYTAFPPSEPSKHYTFNYFVQEDASTDLDHSYYNGMVNDIDGSGSNYALFSFTRCDTVPFADSATTKWDIGFKGTTIVLNGGVSGPGSTSGQIIIQNYDSVIHAPTVGYAQDSISGNAIPTGSGNGWYTYAGPPTHKIESIPGRTILVKTTTGDYYKVEVVSYYKGNPDLSQYAAFPPAEASKHYTLRFQKIDSASISICMVDTTAYCDLDASSSMAYFSLDNRNTVASTDSNTTNWDVAFNGTTILINSGTSGPGTASGQVVTQDYNTLVNAPNSGYGQDGSSGKAIPTGSGNGWYTYSGSPAHKIEPIVGRSIVVQTNSGNYYKIQIINYYLGNPDLNQYTAFPPTEASRYYTFRFEKIELATGIEDNKQNISSMNIYPNPVHQNNATISYSLTENVDDVAVNLVDLRGRIIVNNQSLPNQLGDNTYRLPLGTIQTGVYIVTLQAGNQLIRNRIVVK